MILVLDNYDSFVFNVVRYFEELGARVRVARNDALDVPGIRALAPDALVVSPGPCTPAEAGVSLPAIRELSGHVPILGVCLGHQAIGAAFGGTVERARRPLHGQATPIAHGGTRLFSGLPAPMPVGRYHSLVVTPQPGMDAHLTVDAVSEEGEVMALSHRHHPTYGIQFHPESVLTEGGHALFANFWAWRGTGARIVRRGPMLWRDGRLVAGTSAPFDHADRGLTLGDGLFDTALAIGGRIAFEAEHVARLGASADALGIPVEPDRIRAAMRALAGQGARRGERLAIRTTLTRGAGPRGLRPPDAPQPTLFATAGPGAPGLAFAPLRLWPTMIARNETSPAARLKTLGYLDAVLAARQAADAGFDEALFCNTRGHVACAGTGNLFALFGDALVTPPLADGVLGGIVRAEVLRRAPDCGLRAQERSLTLAELREAESVLLTNSLRLVAPVTAVGETVFASVGHPAAARLGAALRASVARACGVAEEEVA